MNKPIGEPAPEMELPEEVEPNTIKVSIDKFPF